MASNSLNASKYAPRTPAETLISSRAERSKQEKDKATRLLLRLRWKAEALMVSHMRAVQVSSEEFKSEINVDGRGEAHGLFLLGLSGVQAESMFKVDFFEFYTLLERYLTLCLSILGTSVAATAPRANVNALRFLTNPDFARSRQEASHQFHANLLEALEESEGPLYHAFSSQDIRIELALAKDYRNRCKDVHEKLSASRANWTSDDGDKRLTKLDRPGLQHMLTTILSACEHALKIVLEGVCNQPADPSAHNSIGSLGNNRYGMLESMEVDDAPMEYMEDAMDLD